MGFPSLADFIFIMMVFGFLLVMTRPKVPEELVRMLREGEKVTADLEQSRKEHLANQETYFKATYRYCVNGVLYHYRTRFVDAPPDSIELFYWPDCPQRANTCRTLSREW